MAGLGIEKEENEEFVLEGDIEKKVNRYKLYVVGRLLTENNVNFRVFKSKIANVWKPAMGISIKELDHDIFLFQFFHKKNMQWVLKGGTWSFNNIMMILEPIGMGENPTKVKILSLNI